MKNMILILSAVVLLVVANDAQAFWRHRAVARHCQQSASCCQQQTVVYPQTVINQQVAPVVVQASYQQPAQPLWQEVFGPFQQGTPVGCPNGICPLRR